MEKMHLVTALHMYYLLILYPQQNDYYYPRLFDNNKPYVPLTCFFQIYLNIVMNKGNTSSQLQNWSTI